MTDAAARGDGLAAPVDVQKLEAMQREVMRGRGFFEPFMPPIIGDAAVIGDPMPVAPATALRCGAPHVRYAVPRDPVAAIEDLALALVDGAQAMRRGLLLAGARMRPEGRAVLAGIDAFLAALRVADVETTTTAGEADGEDL